MPLIGSFGSGGSRGFGRFGITVQLPTGGVISLYNGYRIHLFTESGTFNSKGIKKSITMFLVAGGGGGGYGYVGWGSGGGGGGHVQVLGIAGNQPEFEQTIFIGAGGARGGTLGSSSYTFGAFLGSTYGGGGAGSAFGGNGTSGAYGGSGGGGALWGGVGGVGLYAGSGGNTVGDGNSGGGGGGGAKSDGLHGWNGGAGGAGYSLAELGIPDLGLLRQSFGGGGGGSWPYNPHLGLGKDGGGDGASAFTPRGNDGSINSGGGGGGAKENNVTSGGNGGSGCVIVYYSYP